jgi:hypothetical protein
MSLGYLGLVASWSLPRVAISINKRRYNDIP